jgi:major vault protein
VQDTAQASFDVENYVKVLADHCRSRMRNAAKRCGIQEFYTNAIDIIRDAILGEVPDGGRRPGLAFAENGMRVYDVEVLNVSIEERNVAELLVGAQKDALRGAIELSTAQQAADRTSKLEHLKRLGIDERQKTAGKEAEFAKAQIGRVLGQRLAQADADLKVATEEKKVTDVELAADREAQEQEIELARKNAAQELERLAKETEEYVKRIGAVSGEMITALQMFGDKLFVEKIVEAVGPVALATGVTTADIFSQVFKGTPFEGMMKALADRPLKSTERD